MMVGKLKKMIDLELKSPTILKVDYLCTQTFETTIFCICFHQRFHELNFLELLNQGFLEYNETYRQS